MTVAVVLFPGTNCEQDCLEAIRMLGGQADLVWHREASLPAATSAVIVPGGFSYGDYLRTGAIARFSPVMTAVADFAAAGGPILGICNGFQILCEAGLLPGALQKNRGLKFLCGMATLRVETTATPATAGLSTGQQLRLPINHFEGSFVCDERTLRSLRAEEQVVFRYVENPNGSIDEIAGVCNEARNVVGLMPHPERAVLELLGSTDGVGILTGLLAASVPSS